MYIDNLANSMERAHFLAAEDRRRNAMALAELRILRREARGEATAGVSKVTAVRLVIGHLLIAAGNRLSGASAATTTTLTAHGHS
jgi:hypothetical protein